MNLTGDLTLPQALAARAAASPQRPAISYEDRTFTYAQFHGAVHALAAGLYDLGVRAGDRVALLFPTCPQFPISYFAALELGATVIPLHCLLAPEEAIYIVSNAGASTLIGLDVLAPLATVLQRNIPGLQRVIISGDGAPEGVTRWEPLLATPPRAVESPASPEDIAALIYTSGTTGRPKGAMLSHRNLMFDASACVNRIEVSEDDVFLTVLPLFHSFGATACMILPIITGSHTVLVPRFAPERLFAAFETSRATIFIGVPSMYAAMLAVRPARQYDLSALRVCVSGGAPMPTELQQAFTARFGVPMIEGYGPTEASPVVCVNLLHGVNKLGSVGPALPGVEVRIVDDSGAPLPTGEIGEITVRGGNVMRGYWRDEELTRETLRDGWLFTGDVGMMDEDGYVSIVDRKKDMIIVGGMNVYPREVEDVIYRVPQVAEAAVVGVPAALRGEDVKAFVALKEGERLAAEELLDYCAQFLARYKVPRTVEFREQLPKSDTGKILKRALRGEAEASA